LIDGKIHVKNVATGIWLGLGLTITLDCIDQIILKTLGASLPDTDDVSTLAFSAITMPMTWLLLALMLTKLFVWLSVLKRADLSFAQPLTSLSYVGVGILSFLWLGEVWTIRTVLSVVLILVGVSLVSSSNSDPIEEERVQ
jgi:drug/metabolite transporter (DMT)-like permease